MNLDPNDPNITSVVAFDRGTVTYYKGGSYVVRNDEENTLRINYHNGDRVIFQHDGSEYHVVRIITHDGIEFPAQESKASVLVEGSSDCPCKSEV